MTKVRTRTWHTCQGAAHDIGEEYEVDDALLDTVIALGFAERADTPTPAAAPTPTTVKPMAKAGK